jgi:hypothetical protein
MLRSIGSTRPDRRPRSEPRFAARASRIVWLACLLATAACQEAAPPDPKQGSLTSAPDSAATAAEARASLAGERAPGADAYSFRGLWAGIPRPRLEAALQNASAQGPAVPTCVPSTKADTELLCGYEAVLGVDRARVRVDATYSPATRTTPMVAREISITRQLPLDVDGVRLAGILADAFETQTTLLDSRDATYGRHEAHVRMGTLNGARTHFAEVTVTSHGGREEMVVRMGRGAKPAK